MAGGGGGGAGWEWFSADGPLNSSSPLAGFETAISADTLTPIRLRYSFVPAVLGGVAADFIFALQYSRNGGADQYVGVGPDVLPAPDGWYADGAPTAEVLLGAGFAPGEGIQTVRSSQAIAIPQDGTTGTELVWSLYLADGAIGDSFTFQLVTLAAVASTAAELVAGTVTASFSGAGLIVGGIGKLELGGLNHMAERASVYEGVQLAAETTPGTPLAADRRLLLIDIDPEPKTEIKTIETRGFKTPTGVVVGKEYTTGKVSGTLAYADALYIFSSVFCKSPTPAAPAPSNILTIGTQASGTYTLTYGAQTTTAIAYGATAQQIAAALEALSSVGIGNVFVVPTTTANQFTVTFQFAQGTNSGALTGTFTGLGTPANASIVSHSPTLTKRWEFIPQYNQPDSIQTYTVESGAFNIATFGKQIAQVAFDQLGLKINKQEATLTGNIIGQPMTDPFTLTTTGITELPSQPVDPGSVSVYIGSSTSGITRQVRLTEFDFSMSPRFGPIMTLDSSVAGFSNLVELAPKAKVKFDMEQDAQGQALLADMRAGTIMYARIEAIGQQIETGFNYRVMMTFPFVLTSAPPKNSDGLYSTDFGGEIMYSTVFGGWVKAEIDTTISAL